MKTIIIIIACVACLASNLQAAYIAKQWQRNEVALLPKKPFGGFEHVLLVQELPTKWHVVFLKDSSGTAKWNFDNVKTVSTKQLQKIPVRNRIVVEEFDISGGEIYINKSRRETEIPFIKPE